MSPPAYRAPLTYYVSNAGSDSNDGLSVGTSWASIDRINSAVTTAEVRAGDSVLFNRGDTFYGSVSKVGATFAAYGTGARPVISAYKILNTAASWSLFSTGVWRLDLLNTAGYTGYAGTGVNTDLNIGFLRTDGTIQPYKRSDVASLSVQWDFYSDNVQYLYVKSSANPTTLATDLRAASGLRTFTAADGFTATGLHIQGVGGHAFSSRGSGVHIYDNEISEIGGAYLTGFGTGTTRYGNGIESAIGSADWLVEANDIHDVYDVALTCQGSLIHPYLGWTNIRFTANTVARCSQSTEFWSDGTTETGAGFVNVSVDNNTFTDAGLSPFSPSRPAGIDTTLSHRLSFQWVLPADITIENNHFTGLGGSGAAYRYKKADPVGLVSRNNTITLPAGTLMDFDEAYTIETAAAWVLANNTEVGSTFVIT